MCQSVADVDTMCHHYERGTAPWERIEERETEDDEPAEEIETPEIEIEEMEEPEIETPEVADD